MYTILAVATTFSWAQATHESNAKTSGDVVDTIEEQNVKPDVLDKSRDYIGDSYVSLAEKLDIFIARKPRDRNYNNSALSVLVSATNFEGSEAAHDISIRSKLDLPGTKDRFQLFLETDPDESDTLANANRPVSTGERITRQDAVAGIEFSTKEQLARWRHSVSLGGKLNDGIDLLVRYRLRKSWQLPNRWMSQVRQDFWYQDGIGWGETSHLKFARPIADKYLFDVVTQFRAEDSDDPYEYANVWRLDHRFLDSWNVTYKFGLLGESDGGTMLDDFFINFSLGYRLKRNWVYVFLTPEIFYAEESRHKPERSLTLSFELLFTD